MKIENKFLGIKHIILKDKWKCPEPHKQLIFLRQERWMLIFQNYGNDMIFILI